jgi:Kef-type K+ transport system membrane component KefB
MGIAVFLGAVLSLRLGITVAIFEIAAGVIAGSYLGVRSTDWLVHFAEFGSLLLIFLAGSDIDFAFLQRSQALSQTEAARVVHPHLPILITIIDTQESIKGFLAVLDTMVTRGCLIALSDVDVIKYTHHSDEKTS